MKKNKCQLYVITPSNFNIKKFSRRLLKAFDGGDIAVLQIRLKNSTDDTICEAIETFLPIAKKFNTTVLVNDRPDLAKKTGCDGVHIGQQDCGYEESRKTVGKDKIVGVTCHDSSHLAMEASERGADYVAFGAFFPTSTKKTIYQPKVDLINSWSETTTIPNVAIGGITQRNCVPLIKAGADFLAVVSSIWNYPSGEEAAVSDFNKLFEIHNG